MHKLERRVGDYLEGQQSEFLPRFTSALHVLLDHPLLHTSVLPYYEILTIVPAVVELDADRDKVHVEPCLP